MVFFLDSAFSRSLQNTPGINVPGSMLIIKPNKGENSLQSSKAKPTTGGHKIAVVTKLLLVFGKIKSHWQRALNAETSNSELSYSNHQASVTLATCGMNHYAFVRQGQHEQIPGLTPGARYLSNRSHVLRSELS
jgi:hypothetical protein